VCSCVCVCVCKYSGCHSVIRSRFLVCWALCVCFFVFLCVYVCVCFFVWYGACPILCAYVSLCEWARVCMFARVLLCVCAAACGLCSTTMIYYKIMSNLQDRRVYVYMCVYSTKSVQFLVLHHGESFVCTDTHIHTHANTFVLSDSSDCLCCLVAVQLWGGCN